MIVAAVDVVDFEAFPRAFAGAADLAAARLGAAEDAEEREAELVRAEDLRVAVAGAARDFFTSPRQQGRQGTARR